MLADTVAVGDEGTENDEPPDMVARDPETPLDGVNLMESVERMEPDTEYEVECVADDELLEDVVGESETVWHEETVTVKFAVDEVDSVGDTDEHDDSEGSKLSEEDPDDVMRNDAVPPKLREPAAGELDAAIVPVKDDDVDNPPLTEIGAEGVTDTHVVTDMLELPLSLFR